jgi:hypothetical protein
MTALYRVEYQRPAGPSWWASREGVTPAREWSDKLSHDEALEHIRRTLAVYQREGLKARMVLATAPGRAA